jgi:glutathione S-transferase
MPGGAAIRNRCKAISMPKLELISNLLCPFTQRAAIQLLEAAAPFERSYIDLADKPAWFLEISPLGKAPVLRTERGAVFESAVICEYLEETLANRLHPEDAFERARHRAWIEFASAITADIYGFYTAPNAAAMRAKAESLAGKFGWLEKHISATPYFAGKAFHLVDAAYAPLFRLFDTFDQIGDFGILAELERVVTYRAALAGRPSVQQAVAANYAEVFRDYLADQESHLSGLLAA